MLCEPAPACTTAASRIPESSVPSASYAPPRDSCTLSDAASYVTANAFSVPERAAAASRSLI